MPSGWRPRWRCGGRVLPLCPSWPRRSGIPPRSSATPPAAPGGCAPASEVRSRAAETLIGFGRPAAAPLLDALADDDPWVRWRAAWALSTLAPVISSGSDEAARLLEAARRESDPRVRIWLERAGARLGAERREAPLSGDAGAAVYRALVDAVGQDNASAYAMELAGAEEYDVFL